MAGKSNIEWTGHTWNPIAGCTVLTPGCKRCYAMKMAARLEAMGQELYAGLTQPSNAGPVWTGIVRQAPEHVLLAPLKRKKPTTYFVNSMSDLFHEDVPDEWIDRIFAVMALSRQHTFQVLTKRAERMRGYLTAEDRRYQIELAMYELGGDYDARTIPDADWPLPNVWLGVSGERQQEADERIPLLLQTPAAVRFVSLEPLLGPIDLCNISHPSPPEDEGRRGSALDGHEVAGMVGNCIAWIPPLDWVIVGGESGNGARPFHVEWADQIVEQCKAADVPCFVKQLGAEAIASGYAYPLKNKKGGDWNEWPDRLRVREMPSAA
jgi:protein gp37